MYISSNFILEQRLFGVSLQVKCITYNTVWECVKSHSHRSLHNTKAIPSNDDDTISLFQPGPVNALLLTRHIAEKVSESFIINFINPDRRPASHDGIQSLARTIKIDATLGTLYPEWLWRVSPDDHYAYSHQAYTTQGRYIGRAGKWMGVKMSARRKL